MPELKAELEKQGRDDIMIVVGGVIPPQDFRRPLRRRRLVDLPARGTPIADAAIDLMDKLNARLGYVQAAE